MKGLVFAVTAMFMAAPLSAQAKLEVHFVADGVAMWPAIAAPPGWRNDPQISKLAGSNVFIPEGYSFKNARAVMAAVSISSDQPEDGVPTEFDAFVTWATTTDGLMSQKAATEAEAITTADGQKIRVFRSELKANGGFQWQYAAYGQEIDDFGKTRYLIFCLTAETESDLDGAIPAFRAFVGGYRK